MHSQIQASPYLAAARAVRRRLARVRFARAVRRTHLAAGLLVLGTILGLRLFGQWRSHEWIVAGGLVAAWLLGAMALARVRLPGSGAALFLLDRRGGWKDCFSSAWEFLRQDSPAEAERLHLARAENLLGEAVQGIPGILPVPSLRRAWIAPLAALAFALTTWGRVPPDFRDFAFTDLMKAAAALQAEELRRDAGRLGELDALTEEEKKELEALRAEVDAAAEALADPEGLTAGEMLESLETRARAAERLAEKLGTIGHDWASSELLAEMARHPDTADLSVHIRDKSAEPAAGEADRLGEILADRTISAETQDRINRALGNIVAAATAEDRERPVGERFDNASRKLRDTQPMTAAREFEELAKHFRELASRETAKQKLDELAQQLREAGGEIGGSELKRMEEIAQNTTKGQGAGSPDGLRPLDAASPGADPDLSGGEGAGADAQPVDGPKLESLAQASREGEGEPGAAEGQAEAGEGAEQGEQKFTAPVPGENAPQPSQSGSALGMSDQSREGKGEGGLLSAPIPGMEPGQAAPGAGLSLGAGASSQSGQGGDQAGSGTAELSESEGELLKAKGDAKVVAKSGREGDSTVRAVEGGARAEQSKRAAREIVAEFIAVEEQALDDQSLPLSRRQQVLRYFSGIRERFETEPPEP